MKNLLIRTISGIAFILIMTGAILWNPVSFAVVFGLILTKMMHEYLTITTGKENTIGKILGIIAGVFFFLMMFLVTGYGYNPLLLTLTLLPLTGIFIGNLYVKKYNVHDIRTADGVPVRTGNGYETFPFILSGFIYIAVPGALLNLVMFNAYGEYSGKLLLSMLILLWSTDVGAYCAGSTLGKKFGHKLFFSVSPKKSWEGFWGGLICSILASIILYYTTLLELGLLHSIILAILIGVFGTLGDLVESQLKRNFGVKDSGSIMPGHGGMLDRFDGALVAFPVAIIYLILFL